MPWLITCNIIIIRVDIYGFTNMLLGKDHARVMVFTSLKEAELLACVEDGTADLVAVAGQVDDGQGGGGGGRGGGRFEMLGWEDEAARDSRVGWGCVEQILHG
jgi:hypothetical protein